MCNIILKDINLFDSFLNTVQNMYDYIPFYRKKKDQKKNNQGYTTVTYHTLKRNINKHSV